MKYRGSSDNTSGCPRGERERAGKTDPSFFLPPFLCRRTLDAASLKEEREGRKKSIIFVGRKRGGPWCIIGRRREEEEGVDRRRGPDDCWKERPEGGKEGMGLDIAITKQKRKHVSTFAAKR